VKIAFCTPFKPLSHPRISGDVTIARDLFKTLTESGHEMVVLPFFPAKQIDRKPWLWPEAARTLRNMIELARGADCWLTYGSYYKVPDVFGPAATKRLGIPYFLFQASYAEKRGQRLATWAGYRLNRRAMLRADHIFCNRVNDLKGCAKLLPNERYSHVKPGVPDGLFQRDEETRRRLREEWRVGDTPVVMTTAMMRPGVKSEGLRWVIESCAELLRKGIDLKLVVVGDGPKRGEIEALAARMLGERAVFPGLVDRAELGGVFSAGDVFAFPGLEESVGMVYLEAQLCGLPVVATDDEGAPHVIAHGQSGLVTPVDKQAFTDAMERLLTDPAFRNELGGQAAGYVKQHHISGNSYREMTDIMERATTARRHI